MRFVAGMMFVVACKADPVECEKAVRNYATLTFWKKADVRIAALPADQRERARRDELAKFTAELDQRIDTVVANCRSANNDEQIKCMIEAKTADQAEKCAEQVGK